MSRSFTVTQSKVNYATNIGNNPFKSLPMFRTWVRNKTAKPRYSKRQIRSSAYHGIHQRTDSISIRNTFHSDYINSGGWTLSLTQNEMWCKRHSYTLTVQTVKLGHNFLQVRSLMNFNLEVLPFSFNQHPMLTQIFQIKNSVQLML